jgi:hypothetical protein
MIKIDLCFADTSVVWKSPGVAIVSYFDGVVPIAFLSSRIKAILSTNPWLLGKFARNKAGEFCVEYENLSDYFDPSTIISKAVNDDIFKPLSYEKLCCYFEKYIANTGEMCFLYQLPIFKVSIIENSLHNKFALVLSQCHTLGDAQSLYTIANMLAVEQDVAAQDPIRQETIVHRFDDLIPNEDKLLLGAHGLMLLGTLYHQWFNKKTYSGIYLINEDKVKEIKTRFGEDGKSTFVSTNDILTSWIGRMVDSEFFFITVNVRKQLSLGFEADYDQRMYGNYCTQLLFRRGDYESPELIRKALPNLRRVVTYPEMPTTAQRVRQNGYMFVTNWSSVQKSIDLPGCKMTHQLPIFGSALGVHMATIFKYRDNQMAVLVVTSESAHQRLAANEEGYILEKIA